MARQVSSPSLPSRVHCAQRASADALLVFGAQAFPTGPSAELQARLAHAVTLWRRGAAPVIAVSGGVADGVCEATVMCTWLEAQGVPADAIVRIEPGGTTRQTIRAARAAGDLSYVAVSSPYHARRIRAEARRTGVRMTTDCPPRTPEADAPGARRVRAATEVLARAWYALPPALANALHGPLAPARHAVPKALIAITARRG